MGYETLMRLSSSRRRSLAALLLTAALVTPTTWAELQTLDAELFPVPEELVPNVELWTKVYTVYDSHHVMLHDDRHLGVIYAVLDFTAYDAAELSEVRRRQRRRHEVRQVVDKYGGILDDLAAGKVSTAWPEDQERVARLFDAVPGKLSKYAAAKGRMRTQTCLKDRFAEGLERSGLYLAWIEEVFRERGLPPELARLPFVESLFQVRAHSSAAAVGIWQFMRGTAKGYLKMGVEVDERYDPWRASEGAADHLADLHAELEVWPLALTAYNHGANGMKRAVRLLRTRDLGEIAERYSSRTFGFASRNFYAEFVAAATIYANREHYFPDVEPLPAVEFDLFVPETYVAVRELARGTSAPLDALREMNPALAREVWTDDLFFPPGYPLRVPKGAAAEFRTAYAALAEDHRPPRQSGLHYRVATGDTLGKIATKFGTTVEALQRVNKLRSPHMIHPGQALLIPPGRRAPARTTTTATVIAAGPRPAEHAVRKGETLSSIARQYGVSLDGLLAANRLTDADRIHVGQRLRVPAAEQRTHVVRRGETLSRIAELYGITVRAIKQANGLAADLIHPSQVLVIP
jgi:membrane-bound lytic murein transglycosylase D